jgi:hypothetical protein
MGITVITAAAAIITMHIRMGSHPEADVSVGSALARKNGMELASGGR